LEVNSPQFTGLTDRRKQNSSVEVENERRSVTDRRSTSRYEEAGTCFTVLSPVIPLRRISSLPKSIEEHDYERASGLVTLAALMLPEDLRDMKDAWLQLTKNKQPIYDYKNCQAPFRFVRGTLAEKPVNMTGKYGYYIHKFDKSIAETSLGEKIQKFLKVSYGAPEFIGKKAPLVIKENGEYITKEMPIFARKLSGSLLGKLICRAMQRTTVIGALVLSALFIPSIIKAFKKPENTEDKIINTGKQTLKSGINIVSVLSGVGLLGALGASKYKYVGSVVGMGLGSMVGSLMSDKLTSNIDVKS